MSFFLDHPNRKVATIRLEIYIARDKSRLKYNTGRSIKPEHWDKKTRRAKSMRGEQGERNRKLNLIMNEYEFALERIRDLYGSSLTKEKLKKKGLLYLDGIFIE